MNMKEAWTLKVILAINLKCPKNVQERVIKGDFSTGHAQFEFSQKWSQVYTNRNDRVLNICMSMIRPTLITTVRALSLAPLKCVSKRETSPILETFRFILVNK